MDLARAKQLRKLSLRHCGRDVGSFEHPAAPGGRTLTRPYGRGHSVPRGTLIKLFKEWRDRSECRKLRSALDRPGTAGRIVGLRASHRSGLERLRVDDGRLLIAFLLHVSLLDLTGRRRRDRRILPQQFRGCRLNYSLRGGSITRLPPLVVQRSQQTSSTVNPPSCCSSARQELVSGQGCATPFRIRRGPHTSRSTVGASAPPDPNQRGRQPNV